MGLGCDLDTLRRICADDVDATRLIREVTTEGRQGKRTDLDNNVTEVERVTGNSKSYTLDRLHRERPDLYAEVKAGGMSANRAAIEAGFRRPSIVESRRDVTKCGM